MKKLLVIALVIAMVFVFVACSAPAPSEDTATQAPAGEDKTSEAPATDEGGENAADAKSFNIGFAIKTQDSPYFVALVDGVKKACEEKGWNCTVLDAGSDTAKEAENMETFVAQGVDLIFLDAIEPTSAIANIDNAAEAGIPVINLDSGGVEESKQCTTVYSDNKQNGRMVGLAYVEYLEANGRGDEEIASIILSGMKGNTAGLERRSGLFCGIIEGRTGCTEEEAWKAAEDIESQLVSGGKAENADAKFVVRGQGWGAWTREDGLTAAEDLIAANTDLTCILGENDQMLFGGMTALENAGIKGVDIVAAADGAKEAYDIIKSGGDNPYIATGENSPVKVAQKGVEIAAEILVDGKDWTSYPPVILTEAVAVTKEKVDEHYDFGF